MKNTWITSIMALLLTINISAQDDIGKKFRFGLRGNVSTDWLSPDNTKDFSSEGIGLGYGWGFQMEFKLGESTTSLVTGVNLTTFSAGLNYLGGSDMPLDPTYYILDNDDDFVPWEAETLPINHVNGNEYYQLEERKYKINYVTIPISLKMKTKEIGYFTYFGEFGANLGIKTKTRVNDKSYLLDSTLTQLSSNIIENQDLDLGLGTQLIRTGLVVGGGAEYNISGTTSLFFALHYHYFVTNALTKENNEKFLRKYDLDNQQFENVGAKSIPGSVSLTIGVLF